MYFFESGSTVSPFAEVGVELKAGDAHEDRVHGKCLNPGRRSYLAVSFHVISAYLFALNPFHVGLAVLEHFKIVTAILVSIWFKNTHSSVWTLYS